MTAKDIRFIESAGSSSMIKADEWHHGTFQDFHGDGIMALFGAPVVDENHHRGLARSCWEESGLGGFMSDRSDAVAGTILAGVPMAATITIMLDQACSAGPAANGSRGPKKR